MAWSGRLSTFSTKKAAFTDLCDFSSDASAATSLPERLELTFTRAPADLQREPCFYLTAAVPAAVAKNILQLGTFLQKHDRRKVAQMKLPGGRSFNLCAVRRGTEQLSSEQRALKLSALRLECRVHGPSGPGGPCVAVTLQDAIPYFGRAGCRGTVQL